jgi:DNA (cytosine-5)-methyltransferase 1
VEMKDPVIDQRTSNGQLSLLSPIEVVRYSFDESLQRVRRAVLSSDGHTRHTAWQPARGMQGSGDPAAVFDQSWLSSDRRPRYGQQSARCVRLADLFCGVGGISLGALEAGRAIGARVTPVFAADNAPAVRDAYEKNFAPGHFEARRLEEYLNGGLGAPPTEQESSLLDRVGEVDLLVGGPPCQGHSNLNNHTRRDDVKNELYARVARFAELFEPDHIVIENVNGVMHDRRRVVQATRQHLTTLGYHSDIGVLHGERIGVPQTRHRVFLVASKNRVPSIKDWEELHHIGPRSRSFDWACANLSASGDGPLDRTTVLEPETRRRIELLHDQGWYDLPNEERPPCHRDKHHTYVSVYGRIHEDQPAPTITTGFTVMGQGRFVHPHFRRTLTPREGARLQFFPNWFSFGDTDSLTRKELVTLIGNAVPPKMAYVLMLELLR